MTSALDELDSVVRCIEMGADDYLTKPVNAVLLRARINSSLEKKRLRDQQRELFSKFATREVAEDPVGIGLLARWKARRGRGHVLRHPLVHDDRGVPDAHETIELLNDYYTDDGRDRRPGRDRERDGRRRADGDLRRPGAGWDFRLRAVLAALQMSSLELFNQEQASLGKVRSRSASASPRGR